LQNEGRWEEAIDTFDRLGNYRDAKQQAQKCRDAKEEQQRAEDQRREQERMVAERKARAEAAKMRRFIAIVTAIVVLAIVTGVLYIKIIKPNNIYNSAITAMEAGNYDEAIKAFESIGDYKDTVTRIKQVEADRLYAAGSYSEALTIYNTLDTVYHSHMADYTQMYADAKQKMIDGDYDGATTAFSAISGYDDADTQARESQYQKGTALLKAGDYDGAIATFEKISEYNDAATQELESQYQKGAALLKAGDYDGAIATFEKISEYNDAATQALESQYQKGTALLKAGDYDGAIATFEKISEYNDAATQALESQYQKGTTLLAAGDYDGATATFEGISEYNDAATQALESQYQKARTQYNEENYISAYRTYSSIPGYKDVDSLLSIDDNLIAVAAYLAQFNVGNTVSFGHYEQDNNSTNGAEEIEWLVLANDGDSAMLISKYVIDSKPFSNIYARVTWESCTLRWWLNGDFLNTAFSVEEQSKLVTVTVKSPIYSTLLGNDTRDRVFLLSTDEARKLFSSDQDRICYPTAYAEVQGTWTSRSGACKWWLRSPGYSDDTAKKVDDDGSISDGGYRVGIEGKSGDKGAVRPVVVLRLS